MTRYATMQDIPEICRGGFRFYEYGKFMEKGFKWDKSCFEKYLKLLISKKVESLVIVEGDSKLKGAIAGSFYPWMLDFKQKCLIEIFFWVEPEYRKTAGFIAGNLYRRFEKEAKKRKCSLIFMVTLDGFDKQLSKFYKGIGFKYLETHFVKEL